MKRYSPALLFLMAAGLMLSAVGTYSPQKACAAAVTPSSFCVVMRVTVTNNTGSDLTDYGVQFSYPALAAAGADQVDPRGLDLHAVDPGFAEIPLVVQDMDVQSARFWMRVPFIPDGSSVTYSVYSGAPRVVRDPLFFFDDTQATTSVTVADVAALRFTGDYQVDVVASTDGTVPSGPQWFVSKYDAGMSDGYRLGIVDNSGLKVRGEVDTTTVTSGAWDGSSAVWSLRLAGGDLELLKDGAVVDTAALGSGASNTEDFVVGDSLDGAEIQYVQARSSVSTSNTGELRMDFNADRMTELTYASAGPATGTVTDVTGNGRDGTYSMSWDQTDIAVTTTALALTTVRAPISYNPEVIDFFGGGFVTDPSDPGERYQYFPFGAEIAQFEDVMEWPDGAVIGYLFTMLALIVLMAAGMLNVNDFVLVTVFVLVIGIGSAMRFYAPWYPMAWAILGYGTAGARQVFR